MDTSAPLITHKFENGLTLVHQHIPDLPTAAYNFSFGRGRLLDPEGKNGLALALTEVAARQCAGMSQKELVDSFNNAGITHSEHSGLDAIFYNGVCLQENLPHALSLTERIFAEPDLTDDNLAKVKLIMLQDLEAIEDHPQKKAFQLFNQHYLPAPFNRCAGGDRTDVKSLTLDDLKQSFAQQHSLSDALLVVVSGLAPQELQTIVGEQFLRSPAKSLKALPEFAAVNSGFNEHIDFNAAQTQIVLAYPAPKFATADYYPARLFAALLSGGMFGRLFTEVREKKGLCYTVFAQYQADLRYGRLLAYAGTTAERAELTLSTMQDVIGAGKQFDLTQDELDRARTDLISGMTIARETTAAKSAAIARAWRLIGKDLPLEVVVDQLEAVTVTELTDYISALDFNDCALLTLGQDSLQ